MQHQLLFSGDNIFLEKSKDSFGKAYSILLNNEVFVENDPSKNCQNYPNQEYLNYQVLLNTLFLYCIGIKYVQTCDDQFIMKEFDPLNWPFLPTWISGIISELEMENIYSNDYVSISSKIINLFNGVTLSDCPQPCQTTTVRSRHTRTWAR